MKRHKILLLSLFFTGFAAIGSAQNMKISLNSGDVTIPLSDIQRITLSESTYEMTVKTNNGNESDYDCNNISKIVFITTTGIESEKTALDLIVYVNVNNEIIVETEHEILALTVIDINGRELTKVTKRKQIDANSLKPGMYLLQIKTEKGNVSKKFIKK
ncbi:MAG: T9SS type A sorting domain-containing protein [Bacteroidales bacterium]|jgi:hypothetical protein|nr:T9SS type A sorting domain-containing protein [Bacteroidales bacterium]